MKVFYWLGNQLYIAEYSQGFWDVVPVYVPVAQFIFDGTPEVTLDTARHMGWPS